VKPSHEPPAIYACTECDERRTFGNGLPETNSEPMLLCHKCKKTTKHKFKGLAQVFSASMFD
jgi:predicted nucleic acid-binding Zn ribbon protein